MVVQSLILQQGSSLETEDFRVRDSGTGYATGSGISAGCSRVVAGTLVLGEGDGVLGTDLELPLEPATPQDPSHHKPFQNSNAVSAEGDQCGHSAVVNQLLQGRSVVPTFLSLFLEPTSPLLPGYFAHSQSYVVTVLAS